MRIASASELASASARFDQVRTQLGDRCDVKHLDHSIAGPSLRHYFLLTERSDLISDLQLTDVELFWSRYYWLARFVRELQTCVGPDAGLEQMVFKLLESAEQFGIAYDPLPAVDAAIERDVPSASAWSQRC
jgi:hypothetical protein